MMLRRIDGACDSLLFVSSPRCENTRLARLLRTRYEGTRPCAANTVRNWSRLIEPSLGAQDHGSTIAGQGRAPQQKRPLNVRFGSQADKASLRSHVRFTPERWGKRPAACREPKIIGGVRQ